MNNIVLADSELTTSLDALKHHIKVAANVSDIRSSSVEPSQRVEKPKVTLQKILRRDMSQRSCGIGH
jgi:hypothetical protein